MKINLKAVVIVLIAAAAVFASGSSYSGDKSSMDVVLVMDSSGSMKKTDPLSLRIPAAKLFISLLGENDRAGVISFSDRSYPIIHLTPVESENSSDKLFKAIEKISSNGLYTNLHDALNKGLDLLSENKKAESNQIMILMSDGMMDVGDPDEDRKLVDKIKNELTAILEDKGIRVYTIAFTEQSDRELLEKLSKRTGGFYNLALTDKDFHLIFTSIFESLKSPDMLPMSRNGFLVDRSIEELTIVATKGSPETGIQLNAPDSRSYSYKNRPPDIKWFESNNFDMITVKKPLEGRWEILFSTGENNKAYVITNLKLMSNFNQLYSIFGDPLDVEVWLEKEGSTIKEPDVLEKIEIYIELTSPGGKTLKLKPFDKGEGILYRRIAPFSPGNYKLRIVADGKTFQREKSFVFNVATAKESREEVEAERSGKKVEEPLEQKPAEEEKVEEEHKAYEKIDEVSWGTVIARFLSINLALGIIVFIYIKRKSLMEMRGAKGLFNLSRIKGLITRKKEEEQEEHKQEVREETGEQVKQKENEEPKQKIAPEEERDQQVEEEKEEHEKHEQGTAPEEKEDREEPEEQQIEQKENEEQAKEAELEEQETEQEDKKEETDTENQNETTNTQDIEQDPETEPEAADEEEQKQEKKEGRDSDQD
ncbi:MAG TPA: VWA domain-containing protein [Nitrospirae bacterium]|nr:von Willebrand factor type A domain protein [bacterium BMS3Abin06]HDH11346.1 VWA domain-containing protein [Nitrospirota bacterium]HDZ00082.1 VWA domain-containing protein [Nitrospirota bacterium]